MGITTLNSNELIVQFDYDKIDSDFDFYKITTSDQFIKNGAQFLDLENVKISAIQFENGKNFWVMFTKKNIFQNDLVKILNEKENGDSLSIEYNDSRSVPQNILAQLFLNALTSPQDKRLSFNNLSGKLLCLRPEWLNKQGNFVSSLNCLEIKVERNMCVKLMAHSMTSLALKKQMIFEKRKFIDYPQYSFSDHNYTLKRVLTAEKGKKENFIIKPINGRKASITFLDFSNYEKFLNTKIGVLYVILRALRDEFGQYITVDFKSYEVNEVLEYKRNSLQKYKHVVEQMLLDFEINFVDKVNLLDSEKYLKEVANKIKEIFPDVKYSFNKKLSKSKFNIRYIHDKSFYKDNGNDPYQENLDGYTVQHITPETFNYNVDAAVYNILKELVIKKDISNGTITLVDWNEYGYTSDWIFGLYEYDKYYFMTIHPNGTFQIEVLDRNLFNRSEYDKYMDYFISNENESKTLGLVKDADGNINLIKNTNMFSMPNFSNIGSKLEKAKEKKFLGEEVIVWLESLDKITDDKTLKDELEKAISKIDKNAHYAKNDIVKFFSRNNTKRQVVDHIFTNYDILLKTYIRGKKERSENFSGNIDINYFDCSDTSAKYSVGEIGSGMPQHIEKATPIREIQAVDGSKLIFKDLLPLMGVEFVRYGRLTVVPFPFKYLREYITQNVKNNFNK